MALTRLQTVAKYRSGGGGVFYDFEVAMDQTGNITVRNIVTPTGRISDSQTGLPDTVIDDIQTAQAQLEDLVAQTSAVGGILTFSGETSQAVVFGTPFASTNYRVHVSVPDFVAWRIVSKATTGFTIELSATFTGDVGYDVFV